ncbi:MAG TPA: ROK family protein [Candidatus Limnocylindria bacterium]|nr:ROK family protein [Candidatus Limnocylindria bacterium]
MNGAGTGALPSPPAGRLAAGIDVGGTKTALVVCDDADRLLLREVVPTRPADLAAQVIGLAGLAVDRLRSDGRQLAVVGVAVPGRVSPLEGTLALAVNLGAPSLPLADLVQQATGLPCAVEHDARAAAAWLATQPEYHARFLAYLSVGTGISAGVVLDGRLLRGVGGLAGEVGHTLAELGGPRCACGLEGCLEAVAAGPAIARRAQEAMRAGRQSSLAVDATAAEVFRAAGGGDVLAAEIADSAAGHLARAVRALVLAFGVERVVIGGGLAAAGPALFDRLLAQLALERSASPLIEDALSATLIDLLPPATEAGARGAAQIALSGAMGRATQREGVGST